MKILKWFLAGATSLALIGCFEGNKSTEELCESNPALQCQSLNMDDGQCRVVRTNLIWHRFEVLKQPTDANRIKEYGLVTEYKKCLELAAQIETIDQSMLKQQRFSSLMHSTSEEERIIKALSPSQEPATLYFLWTQTGDTNARRSFLQLEGSKALNTADLQYALATFYTTRDHEKTLILLNNALTLSTAKNTNSEIFKSMASINHSLGNLELAYLWAMVAKEFKVAIASQAELSVLYRFTPEKYDQLNEQADDIIEAIKDGTYQASLLPDY